MADGSAKLCRLPYTIFFVCVMKHSILEWVCVKFKKINKILWHLLLRDKTIPYRTNCSRDFQFWHIRLERFYKKKTIFFISYMDVSKRVYVSFLKAFESAAIFTFFFWLRKTIMFCCNIKPVYLGCNLMCE